MRKQEDAGASVLNQKIPVAETLVFRLVYFCLTLGLHNHTDFMQKNVEDLILNFK